MATYTAHVEDLHDWLAQLQKSLQATLADVTTKLENTELEKRRLLAYPPHDTSASMENLKPGFVDHNTALPGAVQFLELEVEDIEQLEVEAKQDSALNVNVEAAEPGVVHSFEVAGEGIVQSDAETRPAWALNVKANHKSSLNRAELSSQKHFDLPQPPCTSQLVHSRSQKSTASHKSTAPQDSKSLGCWSLRLMIDCLLKLTCSRRQPRKPFSVVDEGIAPTKLFAYTEKANSETPLSKKLLARQVSRLVGTWLWEPQLLITDAFQQEISLSDIVEDLDKDPEKWERLVKNRSVRFPVEVSRKWVRPVASRNWLHRWSDRIWWRVMGLFANHELRAFLLRYHARVQVLLRKAVRLTEIFIHDQEKALVTGKSMDQETSEDELLMALEMISDVDDILCLLFWCDNNKFTIGEFAEAAGFAMTSFLEGYWTSRRNALNLNPDVCHRRADLINVALKGVDGLQLIHQQLVTRIDNNEYLWFTYGLLFLNGITCAAQFAWSEYLMPIPTWQTQIDEMADAMPKWQSQIADMYNRSRGR